MRTAAFTIIAPNYRPAARVLMESLRVHHPEWDRFLLLVGPGDEGEAEPFVTVPLDALPLPNPRQFCFRYMLIELSTAVKPWMFEYLFARGYDRVVFFDPDIVVYSPLAELDGSFITLTPHLTAPVTRGVHVSERAVLRAGTYNLGFLAVTRGPELATFLQWWQEKLERHCVIDVPRALFVDQKWIDLLPGSFDGVRILRHDGWNAAWWNLFQRTVERDGGGFRVNGAPLRFFHFSGFRADAPGQISTYDSARELGAEGDARLLFTRYAAALRAAGYDSYRGARYPFGVFADGSPIPDAARLAYRASDELQQACGGDPFAHPEHFRLYRDRNHVRARAAVWAYRALAPVRPLARLLPSRVRAALRDFLLRQQGASLN